MPQHLHVYLSRTSIRRLIFPQVSPYNRLVPPAGVSSVLAFDVLRTPIRGFSVVIFVIPCPLALPVGCNAAPLYMND